MGGTSFAAPHITGIVALLRQANPGASLQDIRSLLSANAARVEDPPRESVIVTMPRRQSDGIDWIRKAAVYPLNKETHALIRFRDLLPFEITGVSDPVGKGCVGKDPGRLLGIGPTGLRVEPKLETALDGSDTLILGCVDQLGRIQKRDLLKESVEKALDHDCNVFSLLPLPESAYGDLYTRARKQGLHLFYEDVRLDDISEAFDRPAHDITPVDVPVLGVFGTSSQQGKFTLQLSMRRRLIREGYRVAQVGTEPHARLFGMDLVFPNGYASPLQLPLDWHAPYLDRKLGDLCASRRPDIVIVGSQSGTIPYDVDEPDTHTLPSLSFLLGTRPDACALVVNSIDPDAYIRDTIHTIGAVAKAPVILLAMSDKEKHVRTAYGKTIVSPRQMTPDEIAGRLEQLELAFGIPAIEILSEEGQSRAMETILSYYTAEAA